MELVARECKAECRDCVDAIAADANCGGNPVRARASGTQAGSARPFATTGQA